MVILGTWDGRRVTLSIKPNYLTVSLEQAGQAEVFSYEKAGRLWTALFDDVSYRRGLDGKIVAKWLAPDGERQRRWLVGEEALQVEARAHQSLSRLWQAIQSQAAAWKLIYPRGAPGFRARPGFRCPALSGRCRSLPPGLHAGGHPAA